MRQLLEALDELGHDLEDPPGFAIQPRIGLTTRNTSCWVVHGLDVLEFPHRPGAATAPFWRVTAPAPNR